ncbi:unnamed protein product [Polarella glacialis]|uniref:Copia protein n=1 Tax=Polarella glacialis TaxID=89957 RepID=A0A813H348_POLGL|nr:unnamed protein product [Polarella glacialis]
MASESAASGDAAPTDANGDDDTNWPSQTDTYAADDDWTTRPPHHGWPSSSWNDWRSNNNSWWSDSTSWYGSGYSSSKRMSRGIGHDPAETLRNISTNSWSDTRQDWRLWEPPVPSTRGPTRTWAEMAKELPQSGGSLEPWNSGRMATGGGSKDIKCPSWDGKKKTEWPAIRSRLNTWALCGPVQPELQGPTFLHLLSDDAALYTSNFKSQTLMWDGGLLQVVATLDWFYYQDAEGTRQGYFDEAFDAPVRERGESLLHCAQRIRIALQRVRDMGMPVDSQMEGNLVVKKCKLDKIQKMTLDALTGGIFEFNKRTGPALQAIAEGQGIHQVLQALLDQDDTESMYYADEFDDRELEEDEAIEVLMAIATGAYKPGPKRSWADARKIAAKKKTDRGFSNLNGMNKDSRQSDRIARLKLRTKCAICKEIGHWKRESSNYVSFGYGAYILDELPPPLVDDDSDSEGPPPLVGDTESEDERPPRDNHEMMGDTVDEFVSVLMARFPAQRPTQPYLPTTPGFGVQGNRFFILEHPSGSKAWSLPSWMEVLSEPSCGKLLADPALYRAALLVSAAEAEACSDDGRDPGNSVFMSNDAVGGVPDEEEEVDAIPFVPMPRGEADLGGASTRARLKLNPTDWRILEKVHAGLGHPPNEVLVRVLKYSRARPELVIAAKDWDCSACKVNMKPKRAPPSMPPVTYQLNDVVGLDVIFIKDHSGNTRPCLNMVDWGTGFQIVVSMNDREGESIHGAEVVVTSARSPWQAGKTERAGGTLKDVFSKVCQSHPLYTQRDFEEILDSTSVACNEACRHGGYSTYSRVFGKAYRLPEGSVGEEVVISMETADSMRDSESEIAKGVLKRQGARKAYLEVDAHRRWKRAVNRRTPSSQDIQCGAKVYFWDPSSEDNKFKWRGPAMVIALASPRSIWVQFLGGLLKVSSENLRLQTKEESAAKDLPSEAADPNADRVDLRGKRPFVDLPSVPKPPEENFEGFQPVVMPEAARGNPGTVEDPREGRVGDDTGVSLPALSEPGSKRPAEVRDAREERSLLESAVLDPSALPFQQKRQKFDKSEPANVLCATEMRQQSHGEGPDGFEQAPRYSECMWSWDPREVMDVFLSVRAQAKRKDLKWREIDDRRKPSFKAAIKLEWDNLVEVDAGEVLTPQEATLVMNQDSSRVVDTRWVFTEKDIEGSDEKKAKARIVVCGHTDPDLIKIVTFSPVLTKYSFYIVLQVLASCHFVMEQGDVSSAFANGDYYERQEGSLYGRLPQEGIPGARSVIGNLSYLTRETRLDNTDEGSSQAGWIIMAAQKSIAVHECIDDWTVIQRAVGYFVKIPLKTCSASNERCDLAPQETLAKVDELFNLVRYSESAFGANMPLFVRATSARYGDGIKGLLQEVRLLLQGRHERWLERLPPELRAAVVPGEEGSRELTITFADAPG